MTFITKILHEASSLLKEFTGTEKDVANQTDLVKKINAIIPGCAKTGHPTGVSDKFYRDALNVYIGLSPKDITKVKSVYKIIDDNGYYPSFCTNMNLTNDIEKPENIIIDLNNLRSEKDVIIILLEKYYDTTVSEKSPYLWHVTTTQEVPKIKEEGLKPEYHFKLSFHPERVYLATTEGGAEDIYHMFKFKFPDDRYVLLKVNISGLPIKFYQDPNFKKGVYTPQTIPPSKIQVVRTMG